MKPSDEEIYEAKLWAQMIGTSTLVPAADAAQVKVLIDTLDAIETELASLLYVLIAARCGCGGTQCSALQIALANEKVKAIK